MITRWRMTDGKNEMYITERPDGKFVLHDEYAPANEGTVITTAMISDMYHLVFPREQGATP